METVKEILKDVNFVEWGTSEQDALSSMMDNRSKGRSVRNVVNKTDRVWTTFMRILATNLQGETMSGILEDVKFDEWSTQEQKDLSEMNLGQCSKSDLIMIKEENGRVMTTFNRIVKITLPNGGDKE